VELSPLVLQDFSLVPALRWLAKHMETRGLHVDLQIETDSVVVPDDHSVLLFRSVHGLLCNVVNHAGTDRAMLSVLQHAGELRITIRDQGAGFEPAAVLAEETAVPAGRRALGLFSIRERMQLIEGRCEVSSSPGAGTCVVLAVPITDSVVDHLNPTPANQVTGRRDPQCIRIVLVDDHPLMREGLRSILSINPRFEVVGEGGDGFEALELARALSPDVMLMDINMPKMDGIKATKRLTEEFPSITVVGLSVHHSPSIIERMKEAGASAFLMKETLSYTVGDEIERARKQKRTNQ
jgi:CheY-like chemotaxis protein